MFGPSIALAIGAKFVPLRKPRKLPGMLFSCTKTLLTSSCNLLEFALFFMAVVLDFAYFW